MSCEAINKNLLQGSKFKLVFDRLPNVSFFVTSTNVPGITLTENSVVSPFVDRTAPGDKIDYETLDVEFLVNEDLSPWKEIHEWIRALGFPTNFEEYRNLPALARTQALANLNVSKPQYSDCSLTIYTNKNNPAARVHFKEVYPISLTGIDFAAKMTADEVITASVRFRYAYYDLNIV